MIVDFYILDFVLPSQFMAKNQVQIELRTLGFLKDESEWPQKDIWEFSPIERRYQKSNVDTKNGHILKHFRLFQTIMLGI